MARTPLLRSLRRSLRLAQASARSGRAPSDLLADLQDPRRYTRREFLLRSGTAMVGLGLVGCLPRSGNERSPGDDPQVVIVGAGIAGLTAGWRLKQAGVGVRILEAQERIGGRMFSLRGHFAHDQVAELGGELIDSGHVHIRALARELGLDLVDLRTGETMEEELWYFEGRRIPQAEVVQAWGPVAARIEADLGTLHTLGDWPWVTYRDPNGAEALDRTSLAEWLEGIEMEGWFRRLLDVGFTTEYGLEAGDQSALNLHFLIDPDPDEFVIYGESDERYHVRGGNDRIPAELARRLEPEIDLGVRLESVRERADGGFELSVRENGRSRNLTAPTLILALPFTLLRNVELDMELPPVKLQAIRDLGYGTNAKLMMGFNERPWRSRHRSAGSVLTDLPFQLTWETSREQAGPGGILTNFTGGAQGVRVGEGSAQEQARALVRDLERVYPGVEDIHLPDRAVRFHWPSHDWTRGSYASYRPGQWTRICGAEGERVRGLFFAGEHCSLDAQGFMEGGCETGERVALEILTELGVGASTPRVKRLA